MVFNGDFFILDAIFFSKFYTIDIKFIVIVKYSY